MYYELIVVVLGFLLAGNGVLMYMIRRRDKVGTLEKMNDRQANQVDMLSTALLAILDSQESLVDALHDKGILNGNSEIVKDSLNKAKHTIKDYALKVCKEQLYMEKK